MITRIVTGLWGGRRTGSFAGKAAGVDIVCTAGDAVAAGFTAGVDQQLVITGVTGQAVADGGLALISTGAAEGAGVRFIPVRAGAVKAKPAKIRATYGAASAVGAYDTKPGIGLVFPVAEKFEARPETEVEAGNLPIVLSGQASARSSAIVVAVGVAAVTGGGKAVATSARISRKAVGSVTAGAGAGSEAVSVRIACRFAEASVRAVQNMTDEQVIAMYMQHRQRRAISEAITREVRRQSKITKEGR